MRLVDANLKRFDPRIVFVKPRAQMSERGTLLVVRVGLADASDPRAVARLVEVFVSRPEETVRRICFARVSVAPGSVPVEIVPEFLREEAVKTRSWAGARERVAAGAGARPRRPEVRLYAAAPLTQHRSRMLRCGPRIDAKSTRWLTALALGAALSMAVASARARELRIEQFASHIAVATDGSIEVGETIRARFSGEWQGLYRTIPVESRTPHGLNSTMCLQVRRVTDGDGRPLTFETSRERQYRKLKILVPGAVDTTRTVVVTYRVANAMHVFQDHDELYWNVTGDQWDVPIDDATARIDLPAGVTGLHATDFTGRAGARAQNALLGVQGSSVEVHTNKRLSVYEGLTVVVGWDRGFVHEPTAVEEATLFLRSNWPLSLPAAALALMALLWFAGGRDPRRGQAAAISRAPPEGLTPGEAGTLLDDHVDMRDITATIVDLAVRGFLTIEEKEISRVIALLSGPDYAFHLRKGPDEWTPLKGHERQLLAGIFANGAQRTVSISDLENAFYKNLPDIKSSIFESLLSARFYVHRPDEVRNRYVVVGILAGVLIAAGGVLAMVKLGMALLPFLIAAGATTLIVCGFARIMPARTERGARALEDLRGFEAYLDQIEGSRLQETAKASEMFESFLPFAILFGIEKKWVKTFQAVYAHPSRWYLGLQGPDFRVYDFAGNLNRMTRRVGATLGSAPRGAGGSGFQAGSSGGGSGGGGGGGF